MQPRAIVPNMGWLEALPILEKLLNWFRWCLGLNREHDIAVFKKLDAIANEQKIDQILNDHIYTNDLWPNDVTLLQGFVDAIQRTENRYTDSTIQLRAEELAFEMDNLLCLVAKTFFLVPGKRLQFYPEQIREEIFEADWEKLKELLGKAWDAYKAYRLSVKVRLMA